MTEGFLTLDCNAKKMGLVTNAEQTKYMITGKNYSNIPEICING